MKQQIAVYSLRVTVRSDDPDVKPAAVGELEDAVAEAVALFIDPAEATDVEVNVEGSRTDS